MIPLYPAGLVRKTVGRSRNHLSMKYVHRFESTLDSKAVEEKQLELFNLAWRSAQELPFYQEWKLRHDLPVELSDLKQLKDWPILHKEDLRARNDLVKATPGITGSYRTSGSTGEPFDFPRGRIDEHAESFSTQWSYRIGHGIRPFDPYLGVVSTIGGASTSFITRAKEQTIRIAKDVLANSWKNKGFIATPNDADVAIRALRFLGSKYMIGYTSGIAAIARRSQERGLKYPHLSKVILTSETIEAADIRLIQETLGVDIIIEYGASELGVLAGTPPGGNAWPIKVLWWNALLRLDEDNAAVVTTLSPRLFPLINYRVGDVVVPEISGPGGSVLSIRDVEGRTRDVVKVGLKNGGYKSVSARQLTYLVRDQADIESVQVVQRENNRVEFLVVAPRVPKDKVLREMSDSISRNRRDFNLEQLKVRFIDVHIASARGKRSVVVPPDLVDESDELFNLEGSHVN